MKKCGKCGTAWAGEGRLGFRDVCAKCRAELHACIHCRLYDPYAANHCRSRTTDPVRDVERANFCDEFDFSESDGEDKPAAPRRDVADRARHLFGD